ncbi:MAG: hypothetical protein LBC64_07215 [Fibromonadaceae bacterium]|jgi:hypothetical protein|nr:hypothetical protein [Fibromonadaceae bacterium]
MSKKIIRIVFFIILNFQLSILNSHAEVWKDGEFLLWNYGKKTFSTTDFCFALRYENERIGTPNCYEAGDLERDSVVSLYAKWLNANLDSRLKVEDLRPRNPHVLEKMRSLKDKNLLFSTVKGDKVWFLLFDETAAPKEITFFSVNLDSSQIARKIASSWFGSTPQTRLSDSERAAKQKEPDKYYAEQPMHDFWFGTGAGRTKKTFNSKKFNSKIKNYRDVKDSTSAWNFITDSSPFFNVYIGGSMYDFIGFELEFRKSNHRAKIDESDTIYRELDHWKFNRYEFLLSLIFMTAYIPHPQIELKPHVSVSIVHSFFTENIALKDGILEGSESYRERFDFESYYRGIALTLGLRTAFFKNYAIDLRTGFANRGTSMINQERIGRSTSDIFIAAGLEYHIRWK